MPTITILLVLAAPSLVNAGFDQIYLFQNPLNIKVSDIIESYVLRMGLGSGMYSYSAAIGILNSILSTSLLLLVNTISKRSGGSGIW
jgi:putative aldouronate transport system permease protein